MFAKTPLNPLKGTCRVCVFSVSCVSQKGLTKKYAIPSFRTKRECEASAWFKSNLLRRPYGLGLDLNQVDASHSHFVRNDGEHNKQIKSL
jgi:hypothetical protein